MKKKLTKVEKAMMGFDPDEKEKFYKNLEIELPIIEEQIKALTNIEQGSAPNYIGSLKISMKQPINERLLTRDKMLLGAIKEYLK